MPQIKFTEDRDRLLLAMLPHVLFDGWSQKALAAGQNALGGKTPDVQLLFPGGLRETAKHFGDYIDRQMLAKLTGLELEKMPVRERIVTGVQVRLQLLEPHRESLHRLLTFLALPGNHFTGMQITSQTADTIWHATGDKSTDFNYYTKRGLLAGVYGSTILYWLSDNSDDFADTHAFLDRRIAGILKIPKIQNKIEQRLKKIIAPLHRLQRPGFGKAFR